MTHVESFQCEAQKVIQSGTTDLAQLQQLLDNGHTLDVDLPEIPKLKQVWPVFSLSVTKPKKPLCFGYISESRFSVTLVYVSFKKPL